MVVKWESWSSMALPQRPDKIKDDEGHGRVDGAAVETPLLRRAITAPSPSGSALLRTLAAR